MIEKSDISNIIPNFPEITEEQWKKARESGSYEFIAFENYKFVSQLSALVCRFKKDQKIFIDVSRRQFNILIGLMNRCCRLMLGTMHLSHKGKFGETSSIIFRCIFETSIKIIWLCTNSSIEKFDTYINSGLKTELELKNEINLNIQKRGGKKTDLEKNILDSIEYHIKKAETTDELIKKSNNMKNLKELIKDINLDYIFYLSNYKLGSHYVHGTWSSLLFHYLEEDGDSFIPRGNNVKTTSNQFIVSSLIVIKAISSYSEFMFKEPFCNSIIEICDQEEKDLLDIYNNMSENDL